MFDRILRWLVRIVFVVLLVGTTIVARVAAVRMTGGRTLIHLTVITVGMLMVVVTDLFRSRAKRSFYLGYAGVLIMSVVGIVVSPSHSVLYFMNVLMVIVVILIIAIQGCVDVEERWMLSARYQIWKKRRNWRKRMNLKNS